MAAVPRRPERRRLHSSLLLQTVLAFSSVTSSRAAGHATTDNNATLRQQRLCDGAHCWPQLWLLGAQKSATTSIHSVLTEHLGYCTAELVGMNAGKPDFVRKETHFFFEHLIPHGVNISQSPASRAKFVRGFTELFPQEKLQRCPWGFVEATPQLHNLMAPFALQRTMPNWIRADSRFIAVLREPIARHMSWFVHAKDFETEIRCFWPCAAGVYETYDAYARCWVAKLYDPLHSNDGLWPSVYARQIDAWKRLIPRKHFLILQMDSLIAEWPTYVELVAKFSGMDQRSIDATIRNDKHSSKLAILNERGKRKKKSMHCDTLSLLNNVFAPWNDDLYATLAYDRATKKAPSLEPPFSPFKLNIDCHHSHHDDSHHSGHHKSSL